MENSTKALLIAGTVLIVIILISLGMKLFNSTSELSDHVSSSTQSAAVSNFNAQFTTYFGNSVSPSKTKDFVKKIIKNNAQANSSSTFSHELHQIYLLLYHKNGSAVIAGGGHKWTVSELQDIYNNILDNQTYTIRPTISCSDPGVVGGYYNGYILCITIQENN